MAGQHLALRRNVKNVLRPAAHARLRQLRVIVRHHVIDGEHALQPRLRLRDDCGLLQHLLIGRHQRGAVTQRPAVILHMRDFEPAGAEIDRQLDDSRSWYRCSAGALRALTVSGKSSFARPSRHFQLLRDALSL